MKNPLDIVSVEGATPQPKKPSLSPSARRDEAKAKFERLWLMQPENFNPQRDAINRERMTRTWHAIVKATSLENKQAVDLGCGTGYLALKMRDAGAHVDAVDIASNALKLMEKHDLRNIRLIQDWMPKTVLTDDHYDLVLAADVIAELSPHDFRLFVSELARLVKEDGVVICSTAVDINSDDSLDRFKELVLTEFNVSNWIVSYNRLYIRLLNFFAAPKRLAEKQGPLVFLWKAISFLTNPFCHYLSQADRLMLPLEKVSRFLWNDHGISHAICIGKRKPLAVPGEESVSSTPLRKMPKWE